MADCGEYTERRDQKDGEEHNRAVFEAASQREFNALQQPVGQHVERDRGQRVIEGAQTCRSLAGQGLTQKGRCVIRTRDADDERASIDQQGR